MKFGLGLIALSFLATTALAGVPISPGTYEGGGHWMGADGFKSTFTTVTNVEVKDNTVTVKEKLSIKTDKEPLTFEYGWTGTFGEHGFFEVSDGSQKTGSGVCYPHYCQMQGVGKTADSQFTETLTFARRRIYRSGFDTSAGGMSAWRGVMKLKRK